VTLGKQTAWLSAFSVPLQQASVLTHH